MPCLRQIRAVPALCSSERCLNSRQWDSYYRRWTWTYSLVTRDEQIAISETISLHCQLIEKRNSTISLRLFLTCIVSTALTVKIPLFDHTHWFSWCLFHQVQMRRNINTRRELYRNTISIRQIHLTCVAIFLSQLRTLFVTLFFFLQKTWRWRKTNNVCYWNILLIKSTSKTSTWLFFRTIKKIFKKYI